MQKGASLWPAAVPASRVMGSLMLARQGGSNEYGVVERDDGFLWVSPGADMYFSAYDDWPASNRRAMRYVRGRVLDLGCGAGRISLHLQRKGFDVIGIDHSTSAIKVCRMRGLKAARVLPVDQIEELRPKVFDTVLLMGNSFGILRSASNARRFLKRLQGITTATATLLAETHTPYLDQREFQRAYREWNRSRGRSPGQERIRLRFHREISLWFDDLSVSPPELSRIASGTGWAIDTLLETPGSAYYVAVLNRISR